LICGIATVVGAMFSADGDVDGVDLVNAVQPDATDALRSLLARVADVILDASSGHEQELFVRADVDRSKF
jgi:hypothetical protein